jgi:hypothetical protein
MEGGAVGHNFEMGLPKDYPCQVWFNLVLNQIKENLAGMVFGWSPFNIVSDSPALHSKWLLLLKIEISLVVNFCFTIPAKFALIWLSGFIREDLNVIFYQNMPNLHNRYKSTERKISQKNLEYMLNYSLPCSDTTWRMELKIVMNDHCKLLTKCCYFLDRLKIQDGHQRGT